MPAAEHPTRQVLGIPAVRYFVVSRFFSGLARGLLHATLAWHVWKLSDSAFYLGVLGVLEFLPVIPVSLFAGALADSYDRKHIVIASQTAMLAGSVLRQILNRTAVTSAKVLTRSRRPAVRTESETGFRPCVHW